jgi:mRNA interferase RelE/StbE
VESGEGKASYRVTITPAAVRDLKQLHKSLDRRQLERIDVAIRGLSTDPRPTGCKLLEGTKDIFRMRVGDYRILYGIDNDQRSVRVARVRHRRDVYKS